MRRYKTKFKVLYQVKGISIVGCAFFFWGQFAEYSTIGVTNFQFSDSKDYHFLYVWKSRIPHVKDLLTWNYMKMLH